MNHPRRLVPFAGSAGLWQASQPGLASYANTTLGGAGSPADSYDAAALNLLNVLNGADSLLKAIGTAGDALDASTKALDAINLPDLDAAITAAQRASTAQLADLGAAVGQIGSSAKPPTTVYGLPTPPVLTAGCGATSGGGGGLGTYGPSAYATSIGVALGTMAHTLFADGLIGLQTATFMVSWVPIIGVAIGLGLLLAHFIGHGCGEACIDASKAEQIYEAGADNLAALYKLGMITLNEALTGMAYMMTAGQQHEAAFSDKQGDKGAANLTNVIKAEMRSIQGIKPPKPVGLDVAAAHLSYVSGPGWYPDSLAAASQLTDEYLNTIAANPRKG